MASGSRKRHGPPRTARSFAAPQATAAMTRQGCRACAFARTPPLPPPPPQVAALQARVLRRLTVGLSDSIVALILSNGLHSLWRPRAASRALGARVASMLMRCPHRCLADNLTVSTTGHHAQPCGQAVSRDRVRGGSMSLQSSATFPDTIVERFHRASHYCGGFSGPSRRNCSEPPHG